MIKNGVSACSTDKIPRKKKYVQEWWSCPTRQHSPNLEYDIWCLKNGIPYQWSYVEYCAVFCIEFKTSEDLLAFRLTFEL